ncbi:TetR family transcriptional regulator [Pueribacillus theae]|uniref:TetR family transcriptional regulator n=1 Tax=Pueribacillus theae TaxID=2171751 RepID=A0A2U1K2J9_9BACI|nr:TetR/AcrR family transcriptional regulator [Pueribacillus theae]PWA11203.1 TetR family transcriptional regulator [Pueribacillus theae]
MVKKQLIMEKALELFANQGFRATSVQQITEHCGISKGAFYLSFKSKDELILALIDRFMMKAIANFDHIVKNTNKNQLLYEFYRASYNNFHQHADFAKIFIKETQTFNEELISKIRYYDQLLEKCILTMIERLYGKNVKKSKFDLLYCIKSFLNMYGELLLFSNNIKLDIDLLSKSLVEKTNLLAKNITIPFITEQQFQLMKYKSGLEEITKEDIIEMIEQKTEEIEESIEKESLILLKRNLHDPNLAPAIVKGLIENLRNHPDCEWIAYLLRNYYRL